ncbi:MAG TPA: TatD family hydrolase [Syntrophomonadaceae bacterium]|nr:TatD family hydrolase [Syntrophomonadaceae bacterium]HRX20265.1 TatD family hydrolase [Syntrophomonadaceae bacterium]
MLVDTHAHLQEDYSDLNVVIQKAANNSVEKIICIGYDYQSSLTAVRLARKYKEIFAVVGVHPHDAKELNEDILAKLFDLGREHKVVAIGEIGLDYYRNLSPKEVQQKAFVAQLQLARELKKPIVIHDRDAHQDVLDTLKTEKGGVNEGIMHCYSGHLPLAVELMKMGFYISFAGPVTYKNAKKTQEVAAKIPLDRLLVETDCPYLTPEPFRGKMNEPANVLLVAEKIAQIRQKTLEEIAYQTSLNAHRVFHIKTSI